MTKKIIRITESDLHRIIKECLNEVYTADDYSSFSSTVDKDRVNSKEFKKHFDRMDKEANRDPFEPETKEFLNRPNAAQDYEHFPRQSRRSGGEKDYNDLKDGSKRVRDHKREKLRKHYDK